MSPSANTFLRCCIIALCLNYFLDASESSSKSLDVVKRSIITSILAMEKQEDKSRLFADAYPIIRSFYSGIIDPNQCIIHHQKLNENASMASCNWMIRINELTSSRWHLGCIHLNKSIFEMEFYYKMSEWSHQSIVIGDKTWIRERTKHEW